MGGGARNRGRAGDGGRSGLAGGEGGLCGAFPRLGGGAAGGGPLFAVPDEPVC